MSNTVSDFIVERLSKWGIMLQSLPSSASRLSVFWAADEGGMLKQAVNGMVETLIPHREHGL